ncbi:MAG: hypothetical protein PHQ18_04555 [Patescibacteria group bacterium]|nr:hypothetical protein [Patescibacteria group bacterium]
MSVVFQYLNPNEENDDLIARLETHIHSDFWYHWGYYNAGEIFFENWYTLYKDKGDHISIDAIVFPIYYCYRHSVEVYMKKFLRTINGKPCKPNHQIKSLLFEISKAGIEIPDHVQKFIEELHTIDPSFTRFRYDTQKNGSKNDNLNVDLLGMVNGFRLVYTFLDTIWKWKFNNDEKFFNNHHERFPDDKVICSELE